MALIVTSSTGNKKLAFLLALLVINNLNSNFKSIPFHSCSSWFYFILLEILMEEKESIQIGICMWPAVPIHVCILTHGLHPHSHCSKFLSLPQSHSWSPVQDHKLCPLYPHQLQTFLQNAPTNFVLTHAPHSCSNKLKNV